MNTAETYLSMFALKGDIFILYDIPKLLCVWILLA